MLQISWSDVAAPWQHAFTEAWSAYRAEAWPIGAAVTDAQGQVLYVGRNAVLSDSDTDIHNRLEHAEYRALRQIPAIRVHEAHHYSLYTTVEPCPLCFGALVMSNVRHLAYAAADPHAGSARLVDATPFIRSKAITIDGPEASLAPLSTLLLLDYTRRHVSDPGPRMHDLIEMDPAIAELLHQWSHTARLLMAARDGATIRELYDTLNYSA